MLPFPGKLSWPGDPCTSPPGPSCPVNDPSLPACLYLGPGCMSPLPLTQCFRTSRGFSISFLHLGRMFPVRSRAGEGASECPFLSFSGCKKPVSASGKEMDWAQMACHRCLMYLGDLCKNLHLSFWVWAPGQTESCFRCWYLLVCDGRAGGVVWPL